jgi:hypothetical protein
MVACIYIGWEVGGYMIDLIGTYLLQPYPIYYEL